MKALLERLRAPGWLGHAVAATLGAAGVLGFAPYGIWPLLMLSGLGLLWSLSESRGRAAFARGFFWAMGFYGVGINWVHVSINVFGQAPLVLAMAFALALAAYMAFYAGLSTYWLQRYFPHSQPGKYLLAFPALWLAQEAFRGWFLTGFPWLFWGYSQTTGPLASFAPLGGVYGLTLVLALLVGAIYYVLSSHKPAALAIVAAAFIGAIVLKHVDWTTPKAAPISVGLVQGNVPQEVKWSRESLAPTVEIYSGLTRELWASDLIVWPEAALPAFKHQIPAVVDYLDGEARKHKTTLVLGLPTADLETRHYYNSVLVLGLGEGTYHKQHLVPFGEYVPFEALLRGMIAFFDLPMSAFTAGENGVVLKTAKATLNPAICYEIAYPIQLAEVDADMLLTVSNDAWFGDTIGPHQHMEIAQMRALENGRYLLRATNNGITAIVDAHGRITERLPQFKTAVLSGTAQAYQGRTPFAATAGIPVFVLMVLMFAFAWRRRVHGEA